MKLLNYISIAFISLLTLVSCDSDLDKLTYHESAAQMGIFDAIESSYVFDIDHANDVAETFTWTPANFGYDAAITYRVEIDSVNQQFKNKIVLASVVGSTEASITVKEFNEAIIALDTLYGVTPGDKATFEIRLTASIGDAAPALYSSEVYIAEITGYVGNKPFVYITGNGILDIPEWKNASADIGSGLQVFFSDASDSKSMVYKYTAQFLAGKELKFPTLAGDWDTAYAFEDGKLSPNNVGGNYIIPADADGLYTLEIDTKELTVKITPYTGAVKQYSTIGIIGSGAAGWDADIDMTSPTPHIWIGKDIPLVEGEIKFRANDDWADDWGAQADDNQEIPLGLGKYKGSNIKIASADKYFVAFNDLTGHYIIVPMSQLPQK